VPNNRRTTVLILGSLLLLSASAHAEERRSRLDLIGWITGCWQKKEAGRELEEQWMAPAGGTMIGMSRMVADGKTLSYEYMRIEEDGGRLVYTAVPSGQAQTSFESTRLTGRMVVFENPEHDFPQRITYKWKTDSELLVILEGERNGEPGATRFWMKRMTCPQGS
jgi:hypothetical protein